ncbi:FAD-binding oxidoreductase [Thermodesulfobacteriota bacterium]
MSDFTDKLQQLTKIIGPGHIKTDADAVATYAIDNMTPGAVIFPKDTTEISKVVKFANQQKLAIVPWGSGSKIKAGNPPQQLDLVVCTKRLNHMLDVDTQNLTITVEAGVKFRDIQARLATQEDRCYLPIEDLTTEADEFVCSDRSNSGCFLPIDPTCSNTATIGGVIAANSSGPRRLLYNLPRDVILGVRFVTSKGDVPGSGGKTVKNVSGYDISKLMVGSMGSLGIITEMTFRLLPLPEKMQTVLLSFDSFSNAHAFTQNVFETKLLPAAVDVMNAAAFKNIGLSNASNFSPEAYVVVIALEAFEAAVDRMRFEMLAMAKANDVKDVADFSEHEHLQFWLAVSDMAPRLDGRYSHLIRAKINYRISEWKDIFTFADKTLSENNIPHTIQAHSGSGICVINLLLDQAANASIDKAVQFMDELLKQSRKAGGNTVIQNAPSKVKSKLSVWGQTGSDFIAMKQLKERLDPNNVMSPGRFIGGL